MPGDEKESALSNGDEEESALSSGDEEESALSSGDEYQVNIHMNVVFKFPTYASPQYSLTHTYTLWHTHTFYSSK